MTKSKETEKTAEMSTQENFEEELELFNNTLSKVNRIMGKRLEEGRITEKQAEMYLIKIAALTPIQSDGHDDFKDSVYTKLCNTKGKNQVVRVCHGRLQKIWVDIYDQNIKH